MDNIDKILDDIIAEFGSESEDIELITRSSRRENHDLPEALRQNSSHNSRKQGGFQNKRIHTSSEKPQRAEVNRRKSDSVSFQNQNQKAIRRSKKDLSSEKSQKQSGKQRLLTVLARSGVIVLVTVLLMVIALYGVMFILAKGPSVTARELFVRSVRETSAVGFLANIYLSEEEIAAIDSPEEIEEFQETDTSLVTITKPAEKTEDPVADQWGFVDDDGDGIIVDEVKGEGFSGYMMIVLDPSRVIMGSVPSSYHGRGYTIEQMVKKFDAVAGINAGGFEDPNGEGNGSIPDSMTVFEGEVYYAHRGTRQGFVGLDSNHVLHVGKPKKEDIEAWDIQYGASFGPVLIANGEVALPADNVGGLNPRTAIGQRSDGAILMLVIDGRQVISIGATLQDLVDIFLEYGAVNACNLDGGSSSMMWYKDGYINNTASVIGIRPVPTSFVVLKEGKQ